MPKFEFLDHTADIKIKIYSSKLNEIFENTVLAIAQYTSKNKKISSSKGKVINVVGKDLESLLYNFIDEIIYLVDAEDFVTSKAKVTIMGDNLKAELFGDVASDYDLDNIKAPTYSEMYIKKVKSSNPREGDHWEAQMVLDV